MVGFCLDFAVLDRMEAKGGRRKAWERAIAERGWSPSKSEEESRVVSFGECAWPAVEVEMGWRRREEPWRRWVAVVLEPVILL